jgi:hypothetical protein
MCGEQQRRRECRLGDNAEASVATYESAEIVPQQQSARYPSGRSLSPDGVRAGRLLVPLPRASTCRIAGGTELVGQRAALSQVVQPGVCRPPRRQRDAARPHHMRRRLGDSAGRRSATNREHWCAALGAVALPAGTTVGQRHLPRVGDRDLLAADTSALWAGLRRLWVPCARFNHGHQHIPGRLAFSRALPINLGGLAAGASAGEARRCIGSVARDCPAVVMRR